MSDHQNSIEVFCSYARADRRWFKQLDSHLSSLTRQGLISLWQNRQIVPGTDWAREIDEHLNSAAVILLLISSDFLASGYCSGSEMQHALERDQAREARVIPIVLRPVDLDDTPFARLQVLPLDAKPITTWRNKDAAFVDVTAGIRRAIEDLTLRTLSTSRTTLWNVPFARNPFFLGREDLLTQLHSQLQNLHAAALSQKQAISGLGGVGKTQLAVEYAYRYQDAYQAVLWVHAETAETLNASCTELATLLKLPEQHAQEQSRIVQAVKIWLQTHNGWLLILDNADEPEMLAPFLPSRLGGQIVMTTRASALGRFGIAHPLTVDSFAPEQGALFLLRRAGVLLPDAFLEQASAHEHALALQITQELGGLPLALDQAGAYIEATSTSLASYQQIYQQHRAALLSERRGSEHDHPEPVTTTWSLSLQRVEEKSLAAADLVRLCAFLAPDAIGEEILMEGGEELGPVLAPVATDAYLLNKAIETVRAYSLVKRDPMTKTLAMHRLLQEVVRMGLPLQEHETWMCRAIQAVNAAFPLVEVKNWPGCERLLPHALVCAMWVHQVSLTDPQMARLLNRTAIYLHARARYGEAEPLYEQALALRKRVLGAEHPDTGSSLNNLAFLYESQGKYEQAEPLYEQALALRKRVLGAEHPDTGSSLNNLAGLYVRRGKYEQAEPLYEQALALSQRVLGAEHPTTQTILANYVWFLQNQQPKQEQ
jgi:tetratricopeptide (TPR) repeat protein